MFDPVEVRFLKLQTRFVDPENKHHVLSITFEYGNEQIHISINGQPHDVMQNPVIQDFLEACDVWLAENQEKLLDRLRSEYED